ncbi:hypothetical protein [Aliiruegeria sabulilitoris]|uniref:hypothetical protein n=1 Tax=Aliiruegeria sabulilitoris TaxID=1510458 RepID=UPI0008301833|nr:hypothetical protein [Aliiruegeria sabulilitoris]NDR58714.1 hypothetical protein [Pseudoruegeria sp. M32A2M]
MSRTGSFPLRRIRHLVLSTSAALLIAGAGHAADTAVTPSAQTGVAVTRAATATLNLLSAPSRGTPKVPVVSMGRGSWICSPAGFGRRSRCYRN